MPVYKIVNGVQVELTGDGLAAYEARQLPHQVLVDGVWVFDATGAVKDLCEKVNLRRVDFESGGVEYTHTTNKIYQTGPIPHNKSSTYHLNYDWIDGKGLGGEITAEDNTYDLFSAAQVSELTTRIMMFGYAVNTSSRTLKTEAESVTTVSEYNSCLAKIRGDDDWPTTPFPE